MRKNSFLLFFIFFLIFGISSCKREKVLNINLDNSDPLSLAVDIEWAVVTDPYVTFREDKEWNSTNKGHVKKGEVLRVVGYSFSSANEKWVKFEQGYLPLKSVSVFSNKFQAEKAAKGFQEK